MKYKLKAFHVKCKRVIKNTPLYLQKQFNFENIVRSNFANKFQTLRMDNKLRYIFVDYIESRKSRIFKVVEKLQ